MLFKFPIYDILLQHPKGTEVVTKPGQDSRPCSLATVSSGARPKEPAPQGANGSEATREGAVRSDTRA